MARLRIDALNKSYGETKVLVDVNLAIEDGEFVVLVGPSGCGKSTLLRMIAGLDAPTSGDIVIGERKVNGLAPAERKIAMVFQSYALYPHMDVRKNMTFGLKFTGVPPAERDKRVAEAARMLRLEPLLDRRPKDLSGGQEIAPAGRIRLDLKGAAGSGKGLDQLCSQADIGRFFRVLA